MKDIFTNFSSGKVDRKYLVIEPKFGTGRTITVAIGYALLIPTIGAFLGFYSILIMLGTLIGIVLILPKISKILFPYSETG